MADRQPNELVALAETPADDDLLIVYDTSETQDLDLDSFVDRTKKIAWDRVAAGIAGLGRNAVINGSFDLWQRGTSFAAIANAAYSADRWKYGKSGAMVHTVSRSTDVPTATEASVKANYSVLIDCTTIDGSIAAGDFCTIRQEIEGYNVRQLVGRTFTLSFWVKATKTGIHCVSFRNSGSDRSYVAEYTISAANTWEKKTVTVTGGLPEAGTWDYTTGVGLSVSFALVAGSTYQTTANAWNTGNFLATANQVNATDDTANDFRLAFVQLELGAKSGRFEVRSIEREVALCQRYFSTSYYNGVAPGAGDSWAYLIYGATGGDEGGWSSCLVMFSSAMRVTPSITLYPWDGTSGQFGYYTGGGWNKQAQDVGVRPWGFWFQKTSGAHQAIHAAYVADAEL